MPPDDSQGRENITEEAPGPVRDIQQGKRISHPKKFFPSPSYEESRSMHDDEDNRSDVLARLRTSILT